jgi:hypothetical protein
VVNCYCSVLIVGKKGGKHRFMVDPGVSFPNPAKDDKAVAMARQRADLVRKMLAAPKSSPAAKELAALVADQVGAGPYRVEPFVFTGIEEPDAK